MTASEPAPVDDDDYPQAWWPKERREREAKREAERTEHEKYIRGLSLDELKAIREGD